MNINYCDILLPRPDSKEISLEQLLSVALRIAEDYRRSQITESGNEINYCTVHLTVWQCRREFRAHILFNFLTGGVIAVDSVKNAERLIIELIRIARAVWS